jgi:hypothetical protein
LLSVTFKLALPAVNPCVFMFEKFSF